MEFEGSRKVRSRVSGPGGVRSKNLRRENLRSENLRSENLGRTNYGTSSSVKWCVSTSVAP